MTIDDRPAWVSDAVFYQIFPDRFAPSPRLPKPANLEPWDAPPTVHGYKGGDLLGIVEHLDWITDLGATALYLNPIFQSAANHRYHTHDYFKVDPLLGGTEAFDEFLAACHDRGIRVILDGVFNHAGRGFFQFNDILENGSASPWRDWFIVHSARPNAYDTSKPPGYEAWWNLHALPKLNVENPQVREFLMTVAEHWTRRGIDGWRLDVPEEIQTPGFWEEFRERVRAVNPEAYLVGEIWRVAPDWIGEHPRFDAVMNYRFTEATLRFAAGHRIDADVAAPVNLTLAPGYDAAEYGRVVTDLLAAYPETANRANLNLLGSHDTARVLSLAGGDVASVRLAALLQFTFPGAPCIYYGDEIGMTGVHDPGSRAGFPWGHEEGWNTELLEAFRSLAALRRQHTALRYGSYRVVAAEGGVHAFVREHEGISLLVAVNAADHPTRPWAPFDGSGTVPLWGEGEALAGGGLLRLSMPARSGGVWQLTEPSTTG
jgi:neopullulanase